MAVVLRLAALILEGVSLGFGFLGLLPPSQLADAAVFGQRSVEVAWFFFDLDEGTVFAAPVWGKRRRNRSITHGEGLLFIEHK